MLADIKCPSCERIIGGLPKEEKAGFPHSCADALARVLKKYYVKEKEG